jgi:hypothetical protein
MRNYLRIARVYANGPAAVVWLFMFGCLLVEALSEGEPARHQVGIFRGVLSRKSYLAMFAYFNACVLGIILRDNIAHPWASVLPHYRKKHLLAATLIALLFIGIPMFAMEFVGSSDVARMVVAVIFLSCLAAGLWTLHHPSTGFLVALFLTFVLAPTSSDPAFARFLAGTNPAASAALIFISLVAIWAFAWRSLVLTEDTFDYALARMWGDLLRRRGQLFQGQANTGADCLAELSAEKRVALQSMSLLKIPSANLKQIDKLSGYSERALLQRIQLWRLGTAPTRVLTSVGSLMVITFIMMPVFLYPEALPARNTVVIFSIQVMLNPFNIWPSWFNRRHRLGYESLRPRTRRDFVRELGLALLWDSTQCWLGGVLFMGIAAAIWAPVLLQVEHLVQFLCCTAVGQLGAYAMIGIWSLKRGMVASVACALGAFLAIPNWTIGTLDGGISAKVNLAIASVVVMASAATIALAYRRWCRADLA